MESNKTFWELIKEKINIPIIQRDYAQGRVDEKKRRDDFLGVLYDHLTDEDESTLNLDFVYGRKDNNVFFPIDGQQRLTTLFLLHWYIAKNEGIDADSLKILENFEYATRISSREFCRALIHEKIQIPSSVSDNEFSNSISKKFWFRDAWNNDPTIRAMLVMIQAIHDKFYLTNGIWKKLTENNLITFQILDLGEKGFELTDELYIKMNARGKQLTDFENFKASFIKTLKDNYPENQYTKKHPINGKPMSYCDYFSYRIEKEWCDLFWQYKKRNEENKTYVIDASFMNYFNFVAQMFYFIEHNNAKAEDFKIGDFSIIESVFKNKQALLFLFNSLDFFYKISLKKNNIDITKIDTFFESIFQNGTIDDAIYRGQIRLFEDKGINLFVKCLEEGDKFDNRNSIILFCVIQYVIEYELTEANDELRKYIRVIRNLLQATRQQNEAKIAYTTNVRINNFGSYWKLFQQLLSKADVYGALLGTIDSKLTSISNKALENEKEKAEVIKNISNQDIIYALFKLEEFKHFGGLIHQIKPKENISKLANYSKIIREIWNNDIDNSLIIAALIASDFRGFYTKDCKIGEMWTFGQFSTILTSEDEDISNSILKLLNAYLSLTSGSVKEKLEQIVSKKLSDLEEKNWKFYFLKYYDKMFKNGSYFAWASDFEIETLTSESSNPLLAYHLNPYVSVVSSSLLDNEIFKEHWERYSISSFLALEEEMFLYFSDDGWKISLNDYPLKESIKQKYNISDDLLLKETNDKDRIEIAVDFCNEFINK